METDETKHLPLTNGTYTGTQDFSEAKIVDY